MNRRRAFVAILLVVLVGILVAMPIVERLLVVEREVENPEAIVIMSGSSEFVMRAKKAAAVSQAMPGIKILLTNDGERGGWDAVEQKNHYYVERTRRELVANGVPAEQIEIVGSVAGGTRREAEVVVNAVSERGYGSILVITSDYHTRRTLWTFERIAEENGITVQIGVVGAGDDTEDWHDNASVRTFRRWRTTAAESVKLVYYWLRYSFRRY
ncbi:MAG: YdcF family protein [Blastocatellia bacterium]|nr:YdcF family protein [Blastocatellia bacterium]